MDKMPCLSHFGVRTDTWLSCISNKTQWGLTNDLAPLARCFILHCWLFCLSFFPCCCDYKHPDKINLAEKRFILTCFRHSAFCGGVKAAGVWGSWSCNTQCQGAGSPKCRRVLFSHTLTYSVQDPKQEMGTPNPVAWSSFLNQPLQATCVHCSTTLVKMYGFWNT